MSKDFQVAYIPIGVPTFHLESAKKEFDKSIELLKSLSDKVVVPSSDISLASFATFALCFIPNALKIVPTIPWPTVSKDFSALS